MSEPIMSTEIDNPVLRKILAEMKSFDIGEGSAVLTGLMMYCIAAADDETVRERRSIIGEKMKKIFGGGYARIYQQMLFVFHGTDERTESQIIKTAREGR